MKAIDLYVDRLTIAYMEAYDKAMAQIIDALPTLIEDRENVTIFQWEPIEYPKRMHDYVIKYKGKVVAGFCICAARNEKHMMTIAVENLKIFRNAI